MEILFIYAPQTYICEKKQFVRKDIIYYQDRVEQKAKRNAEYLAKLDRSQEQLDQGKTISFTIEELKDMESDDWQPTQKVKEFMEKMANA